MTTRAENRERWGEIVERFRRSGMTKSAFARQEKLRLKDLENWHYRLTRAKPGPRGVKSQPLRLVPVAVQASKSVVARAAGQVAIDIQALRITVDLEADPAWVAQLVVAVRKHTF